MTEQTLSNPETVDNSQREEDSTATLCCAVVEDALRVLRHSKVFVSSREKMHQNGIDALEKTITNLEKVLATIQVKG